MAGRDSESSKGKAKEEICVPIFSAENMQSNMKIIYYRFDLIWLAHKLLISIILLVVIFPVALIPFPTAISRTFMSIIGGVLAGILGFTGLSGFILYFVIMAITSVCLVAKTGFSVNSYFGSWNQVVLDGFLGGLMSFVLFWTFAYDIVHIF